MIGDELALAKAFIDAFALHDIYDEQEPLRRVLGVLGQARGEQRAVVGPAFGRALTVLEADLPRWRSATDIAVRLDLYEAFPALLAGLASYPDAHQLANAATLAVNPAVHADDVERLKRLVSRADLASPLPRLLALRLDPSVVAESDLEFAVTTQTWPGLSRPNELRRAGPLVFVSEVSSPDDHFWPAVSALAGSGARLRRVPQTSRRDVPAAWYHPSLPLVVWSGIAVAVMKEAHAGAAPTVVSAPEDLTSPLAATRLINRCNAALPVGLSLRVAPPWQSIEVPAFSPETLHLGGFDAAEMSYLGAASVSVVRRFAAQGLRPFDADVQRWHFGKLVTLRIVQAFKGRGVALRAEPALVLAKLEEMASASEKSRVGIDAKGVVFVQRGEQEFEALHSGQVAMQEAVLVDDAFRSFEIGGSTAPGLLRPGSSTEVHPAVLGGTPVVEGRRLPARAIAQLLDARGERVLRSAYPELDAAQLHDAARVGRGIRAAGAQ